MLDLQYHDVRPDKGLFFLLERRGEVERIVDPRGDRARGDHPAERHRAPTSAASAFAAILTQCSA